MAGNAGFRPALRSEQRRKGGIAEDAHGFGERLASCRGIPCRAVAFKPGHGQALAVFGHGIGQHLQQAMDRRTPLDRDAALFDPRLQIASVFRQRLGCFRRRPPGQRQRGRGVERPGQRRFGPCRGAQPDRQFACLADWAFRLFLQWFFARPAAEFLIRALPDEFAKIAVLVEHLSGIRRQRTLDHCMPVILCRLADAAIAANDQTIGGARHGDIKQAAIFFFRLLPDGRQLCVDFGSGPIPSRRPHIVGAVPFTAKRDDGWRMLADEGGRARIDQENDRRLQPLGRMDRDHPDLVAPHIDLALDFGRGKIEFGDEALQPAATRPALAVMIERGPFEGVEYVLGLAAEPADKGLSPAFAAQHMGIEAIDAFTHGDAAQSGPALSWTAPAIAAAGPSSSPSRARWS